MYAFMSVSFNGRLAVYTFWLMSGYVISIKLFQQKDKDYLVKSFIKRYFRLVVPVLGSVLLAFCLLYFGLMANAEFATIHQNPWIRKFYRFEPDLFIALKSVFWRTFFAYHRSSSYNSNLWTMSPELYGSYGVYFAFAMFHGRRYKYLFYLLGAGVSFFSGAYWMCSFLLGFLLSDIENSTSSRWKRYVDKLLSNTWLNVFAFLSLVCVTGFSNSVKLYTILTGVLVLILMKTQPLQTIFQLKPLLWLGKVSFSLYLVHIPIICSFTCLVSLALPLPYLENALVSSALTIILCLVVSHFFTKYIDHAGVKWSNYIASKLIDKAKPHTSGASE